MRIPGGWAARKSVPGLCSMAFGGLSPIAPCGLASLYSDRQFSTFWRASSRPRNQCFPRHSSRTMALKLSANALAIGLEPVAPEGSIRWLSRAAEVEGHAVRIVPEIKLLGRELTALIDPDRRGVATCPTGLLERADHLYRIGRAANPHRRAEAAPGVDHGTAPAGWPIVAGNLSLRPVQDSGRGPPWHGQKTGLTKSRN